MREISAHELRQLAESADGQRGRALTVVLRDNKFTLTDVGDVKSGDVPTLLSVSTPPTRPPEAKRLNAVLLRKSALSLPHALPPDMDAMFWNESAVDKFVIPYYSRLLSPADLEKLRAANANSKVYAIAHCCRSVGFAITDAAEAVQIVTDSTDAGDDAAPSFTSLREWTP